MRTLYLHGFGSRGSTSQKAAWLAERLAGLGIELECPDLVPGDFARMTLSGQLAVLADHLRGEPCRIVGSSFGGLVAGNYALSHPEVESLVLLAPAFGFPGRWVESLGAEVISNWKETGWRTVYHHAEGRECDIHYGFYEDALNHAPEPAVGQPLTIVHGREDETVPLIYSHRFLEVAPHAELVEVGGGHPLDSEEALNAIWESVRSRFGIAG